MKNKKFIHLSTVFPQWMAFLLVFILSISLIPTIAFKTNKTTAPAQAAWPTGVTSFNQAVDMTDGIRRDGNNYYISTATGLNLLSDFKDAPSGVDKKWNEAWTFYLENDIDIDETNRAFRVGKENHQFTGTFDGQGYSITIDNTFTAGLFAYTKNVVIKNLTIKGYLPSKYGSGAFIEKASGSVEIINCKNEATIASGRQRSGCCIGEITGGTNVTIINFTNAGRMVYGSLESPGMGLIGYIWQSPNLNVNLINIYVDGLFKSLSSGGLIGYIKPEKNTRINVSDAAVNVRLVSIRQEEMGGLIGTIYNPQAESLTLTFTNCYFNGTGSSYLVPSGGTTTYQGVFDGEHKTYYPGFDNSKWVTGVNEGTAGLRQFLAIGSLAPVNDVESYLVSKGFTKKT